MSEKLLVTIALFIIGLCLSVEDVGGIVNLSMEGFSLTSKAGVALIIVAAYYYYKNPPRKARYY
jgi:ABC-type uncharacterized transport system permease subunit